MGPRYSRLAMGERRKQARAVRFYRQFIPSGGLCFDVGANVGDKTAVFLSLGADVVAVEPQNGCAKVLRSRFGDRIDIVDAALGAAAGEAELRVASYATLSSLSPDWIAAVQESGRFSEFAWSETTVVPVTTLDDLIGRFGRPDFCKIDVEGYELEVVLGLSQALPALSFEYTFERLESRLATVRALDSLGMTRFNFSHGESLRLALQVWLDCAAMVRFLRSLPANADVFGDVYSKM